MPAVESSNANPLWQALTLCLLPFGRSISDLFTSDWERGRSESIHQFEISNLQPLHRIMRSCTLILTCKKKKALKVNSVTFIQYKAQLHFPWRLFDVFTLATRNHTPRKSKISRFRAQTFEKHDTKVEHLTEVCMKVLSKKTCFAKAGFNNCP